MEGKAVYLGSLGASGAVREQNLKMVDITLKSQERMGGL